MITPGTVFSTHNYISNAITMQLQEQFYPAPFSISSSGAPTTLAEKRGICRPDIHVVASRLCINRVLSYSLSFISFMSAIETVVYFSSFYSNFLSLGNTLYFTEHYCIGPLSLFSTTKFVEVLVGCTPRCCITPSSGIITI